jgi:hypothetical protein
MLYNEEACSGLPRKTAMGKKDGSVQPEAEAFANFE